MGCIGTTQQGLHANAIRRKHLYTPCITFELPDNRVDEDLRFFAVGSIHLVRGAYWHHLGAFIAIPKKVTKTYLLVVIDVACSRVTASTGSIGKFYSKPLVPETRFSDQGAFSFTKFFIPFSVHPPYGG